MIIIIDKYTSVNGTDDGTVVVTRPSILGGVASHMIRSIYKDLDIAAWLYVRTFNRGAARMIQCAFPAMKAEDREFLLSGITPDVWNATFKPDDEEDEVPAGESA